MCKVSIVLPVYNGEKYIVETINSILEQTFTDFELIIVNDGSTDATSDLINQFKDKRIKYLFHQNQGLSFSLNRGISEASGEFIARIDADDIAMKHRLEVQCHYLDRHLDTILVGSNVEYIDEFGKSHGRSFSVLTHNAISYKLKKGNVIFHPSVMFRKEIFDTIGGYDEDVQCYFEDYLLWLRMIKEGQFRVLFEPLVKYRIHSGSISRNNPANISEVLNHYLEFNELLDFIPPKEDGVYGSTQYSFGAKIKGIISFVLIELISFIRGHNVRHGK